MGGDAINLHRQTLTKSSSFPPPTPTQTDPADHGGLHVHRRRGEPGAGAGRGRAGRRGPGAGAVRGGVLLERGAGVPAAPPRGAHGGGLLAGPPPRAHLPRRLRRRHGARRGGARALRPRGLPLRRPPRRLLGQAQPHHAQQTGQRRRDALQVGDLLLHGGAGEAGAGVAGGEAERVEGRHRHRGPAGAAVLPRRGLPPAVPGEGRPVRKEGVQRPHPMLRVRGHGSRDARAAHCVTVTGNVSVRVRMDVCVGNLE